MLTSKNKLSLNPCVLLVKTDEQFTQQASIDLHRTGYTTVFVQDIEEGLQQWESINPEMIVLDYENTKEEGIKFFQEIRHRNKDISLLLVLENANLDERVICLSACADDYLEKPYNSKQFLQLLYIYLKPQDQETDKLYFGQIVLELDKRLLVSNGKGIYLTAKEFELLKFFMSHPEEILTRKEILENVWGDESHSESNIIEVYIRYLRQKLKKEGNHRLLQTVRGLGYVLRK